MPKEEPSEVADLVNPYLSTLDDCDELRIHRFLVDNPQLLGGLPNADYHPAIFSKYQLGSEYVADILIVGIHPISNILHSVVTLVELESPRCKMFTKAGDPSAALTHALRQVRDWKAWIRDNRSYFVQVLSDRLDAYRPPDGWPGWDLSHVVKVAFQRGFDCRYVVVIGRQSDTDPDRLFELLQDNEVIVMSYDALLDLVRYPARRSPFS